MKKCTGGSRTELEVESDGDCSPCVGIAKVTVNADGTVTITLTNGQATTFNATGPAGPPGPTGLLPDEAWKVIDGGGNFETAGNPAVPGYEAASYTFDVLTRIEVRKTGTGRINIRGFAQLDVATSPINQFVSSTPLFILPVGYRPAVDVWLTTDPVTGGGLKLGANGYFTLEGYAGVTYIMIPEINVSMD